MANQPAAHKQAASFRFDREVLAAAQAEAKQRGDTITAVLERALREYVTTPPPQAR